LEKDSGFKCDRILFLVFMEWLFFVTKPSFFMGRGLNESLLTLFVCPIPILCFSCFLVLILFLFSIFLKGAKSDRFLKGFGLLIPTTIFSCSFLLLIDNFTYTVFWFGIVTSLAWWRGLYGLLFLIIMGLTWKKLWGFINPSSFDSGDKRVTYFIVILFMI